MSNIKKQDLISYVKSVLLKYCPYVEDRLSILSNGKSPQLDVVLNICNNETQIMFMFGNNSFKGSVPERTTFSYIIDFEEISEIIDFLLEDHERSVKGINCGDIELNLNFENLELKKNYLYFIFQRYYTHLEQSPTFKVVKNEYIDSMKHSYFDSLDKTGLITLLNRMGENELKELLHNLDNDIFIKYTVNDGEQPKVKVLSLEDTNKNN